MDEDEKLRKYAGKYVESLLQGYGIKHPNKNQIDYCLNILEEGVFNKIKKINKIEEDWKNEKRKI